MRESKRNIYRVLLIPSILCCGCNPADPSNGPPRISADLSIAVTNATASDRTITLDAGKYRYDLGAVEANKTRSLSVPSGVSDTSAFLRLEARGGSTAPIRSGPFRLNPGDKFVWVVAASR